jgi:hypothetical protein
MKPEIPEIDQNKMVSPHAQEIECALILSEMINRVKDDPSQMRLAIYEFARVRLQIDMSWADEAEQKRLSAALERAIQGVEGFSARQDEKVRLQLPPSESAQIALAISPAELATSLVTIPQPSSAPNGILAPKRAYWRPEAQPPLEGRPRAQILTRARVSIGILVLGVMSGLVFYHQETLRAGTHLPWPSERMAAKPLPQSSIPTTPPQSTGAADTNAATASSSSLPFPLPSDYGIYAVSNSALNELHLLPQQVPDKRVAMSTPISQPSRTFLPDGKAKFVVFRRDFAENAPDRIDVRVVARVTRALTFDAQGKASYSQVSDAWNIRNVSYEFRVRPIVGNPEMLLIQPENAEFTLPAGRYVLALKNQGYEFTVSGKVTDPAQCLERTDAANGEFYSDCKKQ